MRRFRIRVATSADWRALAEMRYRFRTELGSPRGTEITVYAQVHIMDEKAVSARL